VIGANGAGKTTLLRILARISPPSEGRVVGRGRVVSLLGMGSAMDPDLSGRENVLLESALHGISRADASRRLDQIAEFAELGDFIDAPMRHYSSGMFMRLAFAVAVHMDPDILLADEVLAVGDAAFQERCLEHVKKAQRSGLTIVFVSHDMSAIRRISDRVLWLEGGRVAGWGAPDAIVDRYLLGARPAAVAPGTGAVDDEAEILGVDLVRGQATAGEIRTGDGFGLRVRIALRSPAMREARCAISLFAGDVLVLRSVQSTPLAVSGPGTYAATVWIPPRLLSDTTYEVSVKVNLTGEERVVRLVQDRALVLRVSDVDGAAESKGLLAPRLEWTVERLTTAPAPSA
jgi:ABC-type polysaccharide/polyol phosphate transport system ATPase subunit